MRLESFAIVLCALLLCGAAPAEDSSQRARRIQERFIAPCCWSETVAVHRSETAAEMRSKIEAMVRNGKTEQEIVSYYVAQHGERILMEPLGQKSVWLRIMPFAALAVAVVLLLLYLRRAIRPAPAPAPVGAGPLPDVPEDW
jgi:cytochrome c-type biogenesis protein CcmH